MKAKINTQWLSALFGFFSWKKNTLVIKSDDFSSQTFKISMAQEAFIAQYKSFDYPDPEMLPPIHDPQKGGN